MVFEKSESWTFASPGAEAIFNAGWSFWSQRGYGLTSTGPQSFQGRSFQSHLGIHRVVDLSVLPNGSGASVQVRFRADVRAEVAAGGAVVAVLLLPVAVVGAAVSWHEYEVDWSRERWALWQALTEGLRGVPAGGTIPPPPPSSPILGPGSAPSSAPMGIPPPPPPPSGTPPLPRTAPPPAAGPDGATVPLGRTGVCPSCGVPASGAGKFCASCGAPIPTS